MMTPYEYELLTNKWDSTRGAAFNAVCGFCRAFGWLKGFDKDGNTILTEKGKQALKEYEENLSKTENSS